MNGDTQKFVGKNTFTKDDIDQSLYLFKNISIYQKEKKNYELKLIKMIVYKKLKPKN